MAKNPIFGILWILLLVFIAWPVSRVSCALLMSLSLCDEEILGWQFLPPSNTLSHWLLLLSQVAGFCAGIWILLQVRSVKPDDE